MDSNPFREADIQTHAHGGRSATIGEILVGSGVLNGADLLLVLEHQRQRGVPFGAAARELGLVADKDLQHALSVQYRFPHQVSTGLQRAEMIVAEEPANQVSESIRSLRSQLMLRWMNQTGQKKVLAVTSLQRGEGRSFVAANLAIAFAQMHMRTLLVDLDFRNPSLLTTFGAHEATGAAALLSGRERTLRLCRPSNFPQLGVLPAGLPPPNPQELLLGPSLPLFLAGMDNRFDIIILDTPAAILGADAQVVAARAGAALLVSSPNRSSVNDANGFVTNLMQSGVNVLGAVANRY